MDVFYGELAADRSIRVSAQNAQLAMIANPATAHPKYWSAFVLIGSGRERIALTSHSRLLSKSGAGITLMGAGLILFVMSLIRYRRNTSG